MNVEHQIILNRFKPRHYQIPIFVAREKLGFRKMLAVLPRRCISKDTKIILSNGSVTNISNLKKGDKILSHDGYRIVHDTVEDVWATGKKEVLDLKAGFYPKITTTKDHKFYASKNQNHLDGKYINVEDLTYKSILHQYSGYSSKISSPDRAELLGYLTHDGYVVGYQQPKFTNTNINILKRVEYLVFKVFGYKSIWRKKGNGFDIGFSNGTLGGGSTKNKIKEVFRNNNMDVPKSKKRILSEVFDYDEDSILRYLAGVISSDGSIYVQKKTRKISKTIMPLTAEVSIHCGLSKGLAIDTYWLLRKIGIVPQYPKLEKNNNWKLRIAGGPQLIKLLSSVTIYGKENKQQDALLVAKELTRTKPIHNELYRCYNAKTSNPRVEETYDIRTRSNHNFFANGYLVHNSGKDISGINLGVRQMLMKTCSGLYIFPTHDQARESLWSAIDIQGNKILDYYFPKEIVKNKNNTRMEITLVNDSKIRFIGSNNYDRIRGTNPYFVIMSEASTQDPKVYPTLRPILSANGGWIYIQSTPFGKNHFWDMYQLAKNAKDWYFLHLTLDDTKHIPIEEIEAIRASGEMSEEMIQQEFYCSFSEGVEGTVYGKIVNQMKLNNQITNVPYESQFPVHTAWDLGRNDATAIIFFQVIGKAIHLIDYYENNNMGAADYAQIILNKPYKYGKHFGPHDASNHTVVNNMNFKKVCAQFGVNILNIKGRISSVWDGVEIVRAKLPSFWIDKDKCDKLIRAMTNYRKVFNSKKMDFEQKPLHDWASHGCSALVELCRNLTYVNNQQETAEQIKARYNRHMYGVGTSGYNFGNFKDY